MDDFGPSNFFPAWVQWMLVAVVWGSFLFLVLRDHMDRSRARHVLAPGRWRLVTQCPERGQLARLEVVYSERAWGLRRASQVAHCSLLGSGGVNCGQRCLGHL